MGFVRATLVAGSLAALESTWAGCCPDAYYELLVAEPSVHLPGDEGPHCSLGEWWYYTGELTTENSENYGIEAVVFHAPSRLLPLPLGVWVAHFAVLDEASGRFTYQQARWVGSQILGTSDEPGFDLYTPLVQMSGLAGRDRLYASMLDDAYVVDLVLEDEKGTILHGDNGYVPYGPGGMSFYYSRPRMRASGTLQIHGRVAEVSGSFWFDRQWGRDLTNPSVAWDWFSLRLANGVDVMLFAFRDMEAPVVFGTYMPGDSNPTPLAADEIMIVPTGWWTSPHTGRAYPVSWQIVIPSRQLSLDVAAATEDQELDVRATTLNVYWEGLCKVSGTHSGQPVEGLAYVELTNYP